MNYKFSMQAIYGSIDQANSIEHWSLDLNAKISILVI